MEKQVIPLVDLYAQYLTIKQEIDAAIKDVIEKSAFVRGAHVEKFEEDFAKTMEAKYCVSCGNGTDSLYIAMRALGVKPGDEVIAPAHSWISTAETITQAGANVVFCDTDPHTFTVDPQQIEAKITSRTVGIIPVHLYGQPADMRAITSIAKRRGLWVLEDCAQAHLARYDGKLVGTFGNVGSFSFYPGKNLGAMGDAGALVTNDRELAERMAMFARHGGLRKGDHQIEGINSRLDGLQAAVLGVKLPHLQAWTAARRKIAERYTSLLAPLEGVEVPGVAERREHVWHLYVIRHPQRDALAKHLGRDGVQTAINYPIALPFVPAYKRLRHVPEDFPNAYRNQSMILSIPLFPEMSASQISRVSDSIAFFCEGSAEAAGNNQSLA